MGRRGSEKSTGINDGGPVPTAKHLKRMQPFELRAVVVVVRKRSRERRGIRFGPVEIIQQRFLCVKWSVGGGKHYDEDEWWFLPFM